MKAVPELAIIDLHYLIKYFEKCKCYKIVIPAYYLSMLEEKQNSKDDSLHFAKYQEIIDYLKENAITLNPKKLPQLPRLQVKINFNSKTYTFVKYVYVAKSLYPEIKIISDSRETKGLLKKLGITVIKK